MTVRDRLRAALETEAQVRFALLFGSRAGGREREDSDWDVAVYLEDSMTRGERFRTRLRLAARLEEVATSVDVVVLNDADPLLAQRALQGELLLQRDRSRHVRFFVKTMALAEDQRWFERILARGRSQRLAEGTFGRP